VPLCAGPAGPASSTSHAGVVAPARARGGRVGGRAGRSRCSVMSGVSTSRMWGRCWRSFLSNQNTLWHRDCGFVGS
jgi:hypothetical protein